MHVQDIPRDYRFWVRHEGAGFVGATAWPCYGCAIQSMPVGTGRIVTDRESNVSSFVCRISHALFSSAHVDLDQAGNIVHQYGEGSVLVVQREPGYEHAPDCDHIDITSADDTVPFGRKRGPDDPAATIASVERYLREVRSI